MCEIIYLSGVRKEKILYKLFKMPNHTLITFQQFHYKTIPNDY